MSAIVQDELVKPIDRAAWHVEHVLKFPNSRHLRYHGHDMSWIHYYATYLCLGARPSRPWKVLESLTSCVLSRALAKRATAQVPSANPPRRTQSSLFPRGGLIAAWLRGSANRGNRVIPVSHILAREIREIAGVFFGPLRGLKVPIRGSRHPWGIEWPLLQAGDSRDLGGVTQPHRGEEEEARQELRVQRRPLRTDPPGGMIPGPGSHAGGILPASLRFFFIVAKHLLSHPLPGAKRIESRHDMTGKATLRYKDDESPG
ncbi:hypothetical protein G5I_02676 [Acromyrmex echinatior]|uniref:Uncharacterized protein n=1 Tax=Acromyrmex echinatior TaxID=103372 RepID=F4WAY0_ACREC|nr:hypothetical protein G5I_02676 [Acromyrmex echinatior]